MILITKILCPNSPEEKIRRSVAKRDMIKDEYYLVNYLKNQNICRRMD